MKARRTLGAAVVPALLLASLVSGAAVAHGGHGPSVRVIASGLDNPRGIDVGPHGRIAFAETGAGRIAQIHRGSVKTLVGGLPVTELAEGEFSGPVNVAVTGRATVHVLVGAGPQDQDSRFTSYLRTGRPSRPAVDIAAYQVTDPDLLDLDGIPEESNPYGLAAVGNGKVLVADAAGNDLLLVNARGRVTTVATIPPQVLATGHLPIPDLPPALPAEAVPTSVAVGPDGYWYVGELTGFPFTPGASRIWRIAPWARGAVCDDDTADGCALYLDGFTSITGLDFGPDGSLYVVEIAKGGVFNLFSGGDITGALIRVRHGKRTELAEGLLTAPADVAVGRDGTVYVTNKSVMPDGEVLAIRR
jgi:hypothetical protein